MLFFKKRNENTSQNLTNSDEYGKVLRRFAEISTDVELCKTQIKVLQTDVDNLRGKFNRKLKGLEKEEEEKEKNINTDNTLYFG